MKNHPVPNPKPRPVPELVGEGGRLHPIIMRNYFERAARSAVASEPAPPVVVVTKKRKARKHGR